MEMNGVRQSLGVIRRGVCYGRCGGYGKTDIRHRPLKQLIRSLVNFTSPRNPTRAWLHCCLDPHESRHGPARSRLYLDMVPSTHNHFPHSSSSTIHIHPTPHGTIVSMVFQRSKDRRGAKPEQPKQPGTKSFTDVPDELLLYMLHQTDITAVLRLRATSRFFVFPCTEVIRAKLKILYVHPSPSSVQRAISICKSDLSSEVEEICFVSQRPQELPAGVSKGDDFTWPSHKSQNGRVPMSDFVRERGLGGLAFSKSYQELFSALAGLGHLQAFSFQESCDRPGLNMLSAERLSDWVQTIKSNTRVSKERKAENALYAVKVNFVQPRSFVWLDTDALQAVLCHSGLNFTRLKLGHVLPDNPFDREMSFRLVRHLTIRPLTLTRLDLLATGYWVSREWHLLCCELLASAAPALVELRLGIRHCTFNPYGEEDSKITLKHLLQGFDESKPFFSLPKLERLEFYSTPARAPSRLSPSLMVQTFHLEDFLAKNCSKLRFFRLNELVPIRAQNVAAEGLDDDKLMQIMHKYLGVPVRVITTPGLDENVREWEVNPVADDSTD
jgi:hypothetical protein